jgi:hypothetical protein
MIAIEYKHNDKVWRNVGEVPQVRTQAFLMANIICFQFHNAVRVLIDGKEVRFICWKG